MDARASIPEHIARTVILPQGYADDEVIYPALKWLRDEQPLAMAHIDGYDPMWIATKHADVMQIGKQPGLFSNAEGSEILYDQNNEAFMRSISGGCPHVIDSLTSMDPPMHTAYRGLTLNWFQPASIRKLEENIRRIAQASVQRLLDFDGECDFMTDCALYYPLHVVMTALGVPEDDEPFMLKLTQDFFGVHEPDEQALSAPQQSADEAARRFHETIATFYDYFSGFTVDRRSCPKDDVMSLLANSKLDGNYIDDKYINAYYVAIATAGHDTTSSSSGGAIIGLSRNPEQFALAKSDPALIPRLVDEAVRWTAPVKSFMRTALADTEVRGQNIKRGDRIMLSYPSANRDEEVFSNPDAFDITRFPNRHLGFGWGAHMCLGQHLAKLEMKIFFEELLPKLKSVELSGPPRLVATNFVGGPKNVPIRFTKA
ncbi:TPA: cytochrome P450 [Pseudomonas aeruginosa]|uniref:cytochrome P450 n=1 Tax=Pseudomonas TaxID=286 RepID=UPI0003B97CCF|nr:cytochrome P450 [Pseudomonas aeruginosa]AZN50016.1 cytochrome P450 [Pseudomonas aeruginosa]EKU2896489.1 cytochrome P450 [Pseudomonas aeruginosa]EKW5415270.1 cytochrome P450 [Pseudomonas aeruginosa]EKX9245239.1 cytochrome P450 [Pseudomonas aeruginosa]ERV49667.1 cytochrome P450-terp [Pseudomonas aeruginosa BL14]